MKYDFNKIHDAHHRKVFKLYRKVLRLRTAVRKLRNLGLNPDMPYNFLDGLIPELRDVITHEEIFRQVFRYKIYKWCK